MNAINKLFVQFCLRIYNKVLRYRAIMQRSQFASCGENVRVGTNCDFIPSHVHIGNNVWLGAGVIVMPGVTIGDNSVIGAGSVVTKDIPSNVVAVGNPCKPIKEIVQK